MQTLGESVAIDPVYIGIAAILVVGALSLWALRLALADKDAGDPLEGLFDSSTFDTRLDSVAERPLRHPSPRATPPHGARAQMSRLREVWEMDTRAEVIEDVARVMRAGKGRVPAQVLTIDEVPAIAESEWEEVKLLPPPASQAA